jgi:hypothetical protein
MALTLFPFVSPEAREPEPSFSFLVEVCDTTELDRSLLRAARDEASDIFAQATARVRWEDNCELLPSTPQSARIYLVSRIPEVIANRYYQKRGQTNIMGFALPSPEKDRVGVIYVGRQTVETVASKSKQISLTEALLARALGRVFAHELAHRLLGPGHTKRGILKDHLDQRDLIGRDNDGLFFSPDQIRVLRQRIEGHP